MCGCRKLCVASGQTLSMRSRQASAAIAVCAVFAVTSAACSSSSSESTGSSTVGSISTEATSTGVSTSTSTTESTTTSSVFVDTSTTTSGTVVTTLPADSIDLRADGLGDAIFAAEPEGVIAYLSSVLGTPTSDTGWVSAPERTCPGTEVRSLSWGDLAVLFGDQSTVSTDRRHFFEWSYGPAAGEVITPLGMATSAPASIGVGSTVVQLRAAYPTATLFAGDELVGPSALITEGLFAFVTNTGSSGVVTALVGGFGCGE